MIACCSSTADPDTSYYDTDDTSTEGEVFLFYASAMRDMDFFCDDIILKLPDLFYMYLLYKLPAMQLCPGESRRNNKQRIVKRRYHQGVFVTNVEIATFIIILFVYLFLYLRG